VFFSEEIIGRRESNFRALAVNNQKKEGWAPSGVCREEKIKVKNAKRPE